jgi:hypothetical protein
MDNTSQKESERVGSAWGEVVRVHHRCGYHHGATVTGHKGLGMVSIFCTRGIPQPVMAVWRFLDGILLVQNKNNYLFFKGFITAFIHVYVCHTL